MKALRALIPAAALAAGLALSASADAATLVTIGLSTNGFGFITPVGVPGPTSTSVFNLNFGPWEVTADAHLGFFPDLLNSNTFAANASGVGTLWLYVTVQGLTGFTPGFISGFTENLLSSNWFVLEETLLSATNQLFTGFTLSAASFTQTGGVSAISHLTAGPDPYSVTEVFQISAGGNASRQGNAQSTIDIMAVPEPATWALMIVGFGGVGAMLRGRRRTAAAFA
ncbi:MAG: PEPxxWA-CTERM sorting domain-containing protein [Phenylobacterium sp.]